MSAVRLSSRKAINLLMGSILLLGALFAGAGRALAAAPSGGAVYVQTNAATGNEIQVFSRDDQGALAAASTYDTGGKGSGAGLGSQGALALSGNRAWLFVVNAGSSDISSFAVQGEGLALVGTAPSGGSAPISLAVHGNLLYVLNSGGSGNISGFRINKNGTLSPLAGSTRTLSNDGSGAAPAPAEVQFSPDGTVLVVTERTTNQIDIYPVNNDGRPGSRRTYPSNGMTPYGFAFNAKGYLVVSEAAGVGAGSSTVSSYAVKSSGTLRTISAHVPDTQAAACWLIVNATGSYAWTTNAGSGTISAYRIASGGQLTLASAVAGTTGGHPLDMALSKDGHFLYNVDAATASIHAFRVNADGTLTFLANTNIMSTMTQGVAAW